MEQALMQAFVDLVDVAFIGEGEAEVRWGRLMAWGSGATRGHDCCSPVCGLPVPFPCENGAVLPVPVRSAWWNRRPCSSTRRC